MNKRITALLLIAIVATVTWRLLLRKPALPGSEAGQASVTKATNVEQVKPRVSGEGIANPQKTVEEVNPSQEKSMRRREIETERANDEWRAAINFYGKVVDENDAPVEGAEIQFSWNNLTGTHTQKTLSDTYGLFSLNGEQGKFLSIKANKEGYYAYKPEGEGFFYAGRNNNFSPDQNNPIIFRLRKQGKGETLVACKNNFRIPRDGTPIEVDLVACRKGGSPAANCVVQCWTHDEGKRSGQKYDWRCRISISNGGIQQSTNQFDFEAPLEGYEAFDEINMPADASDGWSRRAKRKYFIRLNDGNYGRLMFEMIAAGDHFFEVESFINPAGSRNLEPSETQPKEAPQE